MIFEWWFLIGQVMIFGSLAWAIISRDKIKKYFKRKICHRLNFKYKTMTKVKIECPNCGYKGVAKRGGKLGPMLFFVGLGIMLFPIGLIAPIVYYHKTKNPKCPECNFNFVKIKNGNLQKKAK